MSLDNCINRAVTGGQMSPAQAQRILATYQNNFTAFQQSMGYTQAQIAAAKATVAATKAAAAQKRRVMQLQAAATQNQLQRMTQHRSLKGELSPGDYLQDMISNKRGAGGSTLVGKYEAVRRSFRRELTETLSAFKANVVGMRRNPETLSNAVRELFGETTGDAKAASIAKAFATVAEKARTRANAAGMHIGKLNKWALPQAHDTSKVRKAGYQAWRDFILPRLDLDEMGRTFNNGVPFTPQTLEPLLDDAFKAIRSDGYSRRGPSANFGSAMYNNRADHRFFTFKNADAWTEYSGEFGSGRDAFRVMIGHLDSMAHDIAMMEELGPNPANAFSFLTDAAKQIAARSADPKALEKVQGKAKLAGNMMDLFSGRTNIPDHRRVAMGASALRNFLTSAHLGSAILSSISDFNTQRLNAKFVGLGSAPPVRKMMRLLFSKEMREIANDAGLIFENAVDVGNAASRYELETMHVEAAARLSDFTIRASGLAHVTEIQRQAFGLEFMNQAAKNWHGKAFADLDPRVQRTFKAYGINEIDWGLINRAQIYTASNGLRLLRSQEIEAVGGQAVADRYMEAITSLMDFAVPTTDLYGRAVVMGATKPGSLPGEFVRFGMQFKAFPVTLVVTQFSRIMAEANQGRKMTAMNYAAGLIIGNTLLGMVALQMKEMSKGRDPMDMTDPKTWAAAFLQGGGLGIFGDFLFADVNRFGNGIAQTLAGPGVAFADDAMRLTVGNVQQAIAGKDMDLGKELVDMLRAYTPGGSLWYIRAAFEREVLDQLQTILDPDAAKTFRRKEQGAKKAGKSYFYPPGSSIVQDKGRIRAPDFDKMMGQ
jgi:hypothetical protein